MNTINNSLDFTRGSTVSKNKQTNKKKGNCVIHKVACWAKKALILWRSSFFTLSGTSAAEERDEER